MRFLVEICCSWKGVGVTEYIVITASSEDEAVKKVKQNLLDEKDVTVNTINVVGYLDN